MLKLGWLMRKQNNLRARKCAGITGSGEADSGARAASHPKTWKTSGNWLSRCRSAVDLSSSGAERFTALALKVQQVYEAKQNQEKQPVPQMSLAFTVGEQTF